MTLQKQNWNKWLVIVFLLAILWELFIFIRLPKQAFIQGLLESWFVSQGLVFYKDFFGAYLPFLRLLMVPLHATFGYNQITTIVLAPITSITVLLILFLASKKWLAGWFSLIPIIFFSIWHTFLQNNHFLASSFLGLNVLVSMIIYISWWDKPTHLKSFLLGLFTAFCVYTVQITMFFGLILNLSLLLKYRSNLKLGIKHLLISFAGFLIPTSAILLWFLYIGALYDLYVWTIEYHFTNYPVAVYEHGVENTLIYLSIHLPILLYFLVGFRDSKNITVFLTLVSLPIVFWFAMFGPTRFEISLPAFALIFGLAVQRLFNGHGNYYRKIGFILLVVILSINIITVAKYKLANYYEKLFQTHYKHQIISEVYPDDPMYDSIEWMKLNSSKEDKIFVLADALFYVETERLPANRRAVASEAFVFVPFEKFKREIEGSWPAFWVIDERQWPRMDDFGYTNLRQDFQKLTENDPVVARFDYWTIRKH